MSDRAHCKVKVLYVYKYNSGVDEVSTESWRRVNRGRLLSVVHPSHHTTVIIYKAKWRRRVYAVLFGINGIFPNKKK